MRAWQVRIAIENTANLKLPCTLIKQQIVIIGAKFKVQNTKICFSLQTRKKCKTSLLLATAFNAIREEARTLLLHSLHVSQIPCLLAVQ